MDNHSENINLHNDSNNESKLKHKHKSNPYTGQSYSTDEDIRIFMKKISESGKKVCPVCGKEFYPVYNHIYRDKKSGKKVCGYNCARKVGFY